MKKQFLFLILFLACSVSTVNSLKANSFQFSATKPQHIFVNNRILAKVNGKPISAIDVMKKMDMLFYRQFPQYSSSVEARHQFYQVNWKHLLNEMMEKELILADAAEVKMEVSNGDIRQEIQNLFGPNIIANLDKAGLTYDEAWKMINEDQTIRRVIMSRVNSIAMRSVTPSDIRAFYEDWAKENARPNAWRYQLISIRGEDTTASAEAANYVYHLLMEKSLPIEALEEKLQEHSLIGETTSFTISEEYIRTDKEVSEEYKTILSKLEPNSYSQPIAQKSRANNSMVFRVFYLKELIPGGAPPFQEVANKLRNSLTDKVVDAESQKYIAKLRRHFDVHGGEQSMYPEDFQPFVLK